MWLMKQLNGVNESTVSNATVTSSGEVPVVQSEGECRTTQTVFPYGYTAKLPEGEQAAMIGEYCVGVRSIAEELETGEILICSQAGGKIHFLSNGDIVINGQRFIKRD